MTTARTTAVASIGMVEHVGRGKFDADVDTVCQTARWDDAVRIAGEPRALVWRLS